LAQNLASLHKPRRSPQRRRGRCEDRAGGAWRPDPSAEAQGRPPGKSRGPDRAPRAPTAPCPSAAAPAPAAGLQRPRAATPAPPGLAWLGLSVQHHLPRILRPPRLTLRPISRRSFCRSPQVLPRHFGQVRNAMLAEWSKVKVYSVCVLCMGDRDRARWFLRRRPTLCALAPCCAFPPCRVRARGL
jgi:hypothetical protein